MPASAHVVVGESVRPSPPSHQQLQQPHANGPSSRFIANGTPITHNRLHKHSHSTDAQDSRQRNQDMYSKPLPTAPRESARLSRSTPMTQDADRYRAHQVQKSVDKDYPPTPSSNDHNSLSSSHGHSSASQSQNHYNHGNTYSHSSSHPSHNSIGRHRSATVAGIHGGSSAAGLDTSTSSSSSAQGHGKLRRKPVRQLEDTPSEHFKWEPGSEPIVLVSPSEEAIPIMGSTGRRNRSVGIYRDAPGSATMPANAQATYSRATGASAASSTKTIGQERYVLQEPSQPTTLPRHHHSAHASLPGGGAGSSRTVVQNFFPASTNQEKLVYKAPSSNGHGSGNASANSSTPTPKANAFNGTANAAPSNGTNTPTPAHAKHKSYNLTMSSSDVAMLATAPAGTTGFTIPLTNSSSDERPRRRKDSHRRTTSGAVNLGASSGSQHSHHHHALSNSTTSASTEDSSHESGDGGDQTGSDMWRSGTSLSQMSQGHPSMAQKHGAQVQQQLSRSQQRISPPAAGPPNTAQTQGPGSAYRRSRGISDAPAPQSHYSHTGPHVVKLHSSNSRSSKDEKRPGTATSESRSGRDDYDDDDSRDQRGRGRTKEKDTSFMGRVRSRSNSLTKAITKVTIEYPKYLVNKMSGKRESKRLGAGGSSGVLAYSEHGHGNASGEAFDGYAYPPSTSTSTTTASTSAHSPISAALPHHNHSRSNIIHPSQNPFNAQPTPAVSSKKREHKRSLSAQPAFGNGGGLSPAPTSYAQPRLKKQMTAKELEKWHQNRQSPMTNAKNEVLQMWQDVDLNPRQSGAYHAQIQLTQQQQKYAEGGVTFPRFDKDRERGEYVPVPYSTERSAPRRR